MFRIRRVPDDALPADRDAIRQVQEILRAQFDGVAEEDIQALPRQLVDPLKHRFRSQLYVADDSRGRVRGFALLLHVPDLQFCYLDYISVAPGRSGGGIGGALYDRIREDAPALGPRGLYFECLPDDPALCADPGVRRQNAARLRFYEEFGARPIAGTAYETPLTPGEDSPPYLVYDPLGRTEPLRRDEARVIVRAILERKYAKVCPREYVEKVVSSFRDDPVRFQDPRRKKAVPPRSRRHSIRSVDRCIALVVNAGHEIHQVRERGYVESPVRVGRILREIEGLKLFEQVPARRFSDRYIRAVHASPFLEYLKRACASVEPGKSIYPYVFPVRNATRPPRELAVRAGYYCIDTFTPLNQTAFLAAKGAVDCALTAAQRVLGGYRVAYALVRPPGHHAEHRAFGGFCYFNSAAVAAQRLSALGPVAVLDIDYHHGNGTEDIFYDRSDVLTISIHGTPRSTYPYFSGFEEDRGAGVGLGFNWNIPLPEEIDGARYRTALERALRRIRRFRPRFLIVAFGLDTAKGDPTGSWTLGAKDFEENGRMIGALGLPTLVVQEGGYRIRSLGINARQFFAGLWRGYRESR